MTTQSSNIAVASNIAGELTEVIKVNSVAYQACGVQYSTSRAPLVFGVKKGGTGDCSFEIVSKTPVKKFDTGTAPSTDNFTEEMIDDVFNLFGEDAVEMLKTIAGNNIADELDQNVINHMYTKSTKKVDVTYDFTNADISHSAHIHSLILKINKERMTISRTLKRGLPKILIVSPAVAALLITNKMISGNDSDYIAGNKENTKFVGKMGDMMVFMFDQSDLTAISGDYVIIVHKSFVPGDASMIVIPIQEPKASIRRDKETGQPNLHFTQKYAYSENPLDIVPTQIIPTDCIITATDNSINSALTDLSATFSVDDNIEVSGSGNNDGNYTVLTVTANKIVVNESITTPDTTATVTLIKSNSDFISSFDLTLTGFSV